MSSDQSNKLSIGIDFGTTNTTVCLALPAGKDRDGRPDFKIECLKFNEDENGGRDYIPTVVLYDMKRRADGNLQPPVIGFDAMHPLLDGDLQPDRHRLCVHSKFLLGQESMGEAHWRAYLTDNPKYATRPGGLGYDEAEFKPSRVVGDFFRVLVHEILKHALVRAHKPGATMADLDVVVTCPEAWKHSVGQHVGAKGSNTYAIRSHEWLKGILADLGLGAVEVKTEPEAATVYFAKHLDASQAPRFNGRVMIVDYGGGTLDICLSQLERDDKGLKVTPELGDHQAIDGRFVAGVKFDETLFELAWHADEAEAKLGKTLEHMRETSEYLEFLDKLDKEKRERWKQTTEKLKLAVKQETTEDAPCFRVNLNGCRLGATPDRMVKAFTQVNKPTLEQCLAGFNDILGADQGARRDLPEDRFRLLMVGGFSRFELARRTVIEHFGWNPDEADARVARFPDEADTAYAIAKGAALLAARWARVEAVVPFNVGVVSYNHNGRVHTPVLKVGQKVNDCAEWKYTTTKKGAIQSFTVRRTRGAVEFFISQGKDIEDIPLNSAGNGDYAALDSVLPPACEAVRVAFRFDEAQEQPWVRFEDANNGQAREHPLGELIRLVRNQPALSEEEE